MVGTIPTTIAIQRIRTISHTPITTIAILATASTITAAVITITITITITTTGTTAAGRRDAEPCTFSHRPNTPQVFLRLPASVRPEAYWSYLCSCFFAGGPVDLTKQPCGACPQTQDRQTERKSRDEARHLTASWIALLRFFSMWPHAMLRWPPCD